MVVTKHRKYRMDVCFLFFPPSPIYCCVDKSFMLILISLNLFIDTKLETKLMPAKQDSSRILMNNIQMVYLYNTANTHTKHQMVKLLTFNTQPMSMVSVPLAVGFLFQKHSFV